MTERQSQKRGYQRADDELDRALDEALAKYAAVEPRAGLEGRILANLHTQPVVSRTAWWTWSLAAALAVSLLVAVALNWRARPTPPVVAEHKPVPPQVSPNIGAMVVNRTPATGVRIHRSAKSARPHTNPKLDVFPSPQPLNVQERILANYVAQFHDEAVLVARAKTEMELRDREREMRMTTGDQESDASSPESGTTKR